MERVNILVRVGSMDVSGKRESGACGTVGPSSFFLDVFLDAILFGFGLAADGDSDDSEASSLS